MRLDGDITTLASLERVVWQPAHLTVQAVGQRRCSDGSKLTTVAWRANRLVDALAKQAANTIRATESTRKLVKSATTAALHSACLLGQVTFAANNHKVEQVNEEGCKVTIVKRDAQLAPRRRPQALKPIERRLGHGRDIGSGHAEMLP